MTLSTRKKKRGEERPWGFQPWPSISSPQVSLIQKPCFSFNSTSCPRHNPGFLSFRDACVCPQMRTLSHLSLVSPHRHVHGLPAASQMTDEPICCFPAAHVPGKMTDLGNLGINLEIYSQICHAWGSFFPPRTLPEGRFSLGNELQETFSANLAPTKEKQDGDGHQIACPA